MIQAKALATAAVLAVLACGACGPQEAMTPAPSVGSPAGTATVQRLEACPLTIEGVRADIETTGRGVAVKLSASPDQIMLLRARATATATTAGGILAACPCGSDDGGAPPPSNVTVEDFEGGTRIVVSAVDPADIRTLAARVRTQLARVHGGDCPRS